MLPRKSVTPSVPFQFSLRALVYFVCVASVVCLCLRYSWVVTLSVLRFLGGAILFEVILFTIMLRLTRGRAGRSDELAAALTALVTIILPAILLLAGAVLSQIVP